MNVPIEFCWSKFGTEAGEAADAIVARKEAERAANSGVFLWGIGSSIRPSLLELLKRTDSPEVIFTPMLSAPSSSDVTPLLLLAWRSGVGLDGRPYRLPSRSQVTSGVRTGRGRARHYALVCERGESLFENAELALNHEDLRNLRTGAPVGSSQVTSVVQRVSPTSGGRAQYRVAFRAHLRPPYLVTLTDAVQIPRDLGQRGKSKNAGHHF